MNDFLHPSVIFIICSGLVWLLPKKIGYLLPPIAGLIALISVLIMKNGTYASIKYLDVTLILGRVDLLSFVFAHVFAIQSIIGFIYALHVQDKWHHIAACMYIAGAFGVIFAGDYFSLFIFWELMSISSTFLIWLKRTDVSTQAGIRYFLFHTVGSVFLLAGLLLRYNALGSFTFEAINPAKAEFYDWLILFGFCVNSAVIPLHTWLPDAYPEATITGTVFMSAFTTKSAVYVLARGFSGFEILGLMGTFMTLYGVFYATIENNARRILSYHIISQVGYMVAGIGIGSAMTINGACAHAYAHILYKGLLFMGTGAVLFSVGTVQLSELGGLSKQMPWIFFFYMIGAVSISGFPLFSGFVSKTITIVGAADAHYRWLALSMEVAAIGTFLSVGIKLPYFVWLGKSRIDIKLKPIPWNMYAGMAIAALFCFYIGIQPNTLYQLLPNLVEYRPYTVWHILQASLLLGFTGLGFYLLRYRLVPKNKRIFDFDYIYRLIARALLAIFRWPIAVFDEWWSELYRRVGLRWLLKGATFAAWFDKKIIDRIVDSFAWSIRDISWLIVRFQTGHLQNYISASIILGLIVFFLAWVLY